MDQIETLTKILPDGISTGKVVLDAGCGDGQRYLSSLIQSGWQVWGCDHSHQKLCRVLASMPKHGRKAQYQTADIRALPYASKAFGCALCLHVLPYHLEYDIAACLSELSRVLIPGGLLFTDFLDRADAEYGYGEELEPNTFLVPGGVPVHFTDEDEIKRWFMHWEIINLKAFTQGGVKGKRVMWNVVSRKS